VEIVARYRLSPYNSSLEPPPRPSWAKGMTEGKSLREKRRKFTGIVPTLLTDSFISFHFTSLLCLTQRPSRAIKGKELAPAGGEMDEGKVGLAK